MIATLKKKTSNLTSKASEGKELLTIVTHICPAGYFDYFYRTMKKFVFQ